MSVDSPSNNLGVNIFENLKIDSQTANSADASIQHLASPVFRSKERVERKESESESDPSNNFGARNPVKRPYMHVETVRQRGIPIRYTPFCQSFSVHTFEPNWGGYCHALSYDWMDRKIRSKDFQEPTAYEMTDFHLPHPVIMSHDQDDTGPKVQSVSAQFKTSGYQHRQFTDTEVENATSERGIEALLAHLARWDTHCTVLGCWWLISKEGIGDKALGHSCAFAKRGEECSWYDPNFGEVTFERFENFAMWFRMEVMEGNQVYLLQDALEVKWRQKGQLFLSDLAPSLDYSDLDRNENSLSHIIVDQRRLHDAKAQLSKITPMSTYKVDTFFLPDPFLATVRHIPRGYEDMLSEQEVKAALACPKVEMWSLDLQNALKVKLIDKETANFQELKNNKIRLGLENLEDVLKLYPNLKRLDLSNYKRLNDKKLQDILIICPNLTHLNLAGCDQITGNGFTNAPLCPNLTHLDLTGCTQIRDPDLEYISRHSHLTSLNLRGCGQITDTGVEFLSFCSKLTTLYLVKCSIGDQALKYLSRCTELKFLDLKGCREITDRELKELSKCSQLAHLNLAECSHITDTGLKYLLHPHLTYLDLTKCRHITDQALRLISARSQNLVTLKLSHCAITDRGLMDIAVHCKHLQNLSIESCAKITDSGVEFALLENATLTSFRCKNFTCVAKSPYHRLKYLLDRYELRLMV